METVRHILDEKGRAVFTVAVTASVLDALGVMAEKGVGALVVLDGDRIAGVISERDYARKVVLHGKNSKTTAVGEIMSQQVYGVTLDTSAEQCMKLMTDKRVRHLPVLDAGRLVGVVSIGDIVKALLTEQQITIAHLQDYIQGKYV